MFLGPPGPADLYHLTSRFLVTPQHWPARSVSLDKSHLKLGPQDPELALFRFDRREQGKLGLVALTVARRQVKFHT